MFQHIFALKIHPTAAFQMALVLKAAEKSTHTHVGITKSLHLL